MRLRFLSPAGEAEGNGHFVWGCEDRKDPSAGTESYDFDIIDLPGKLVVANDLAELKKNGHTFSCYNVNAQSKLTMNRTRETLGHHER